MAYAANGFAVVLAKVGDGFEVRGQAASQPHQLDVTLGLTPKPAAGLNPIEVTVDIDLQQDRGLVGRATRRSRIDALKTECTQLDFIDENVDHSHWIFLIAKDDFLTTLLRANKVARLADSLEQV